MKFYRGVRDSKTEKWLDFGSDLDHHADFLVEIWPLLNES